MLKCHSAKETVSQVLEDLKGTSSSKTLRRTLCDIKWWKLTETEWRFVNYKIWLQRVKKKKKKWKFNIHISLLQPHSPHCSWHSCTIDHIWQETTIKVLAIPRAVINSEEGIFTSAISQGHFPVCGFIFKYSYLRAVNSCYGLLWQQPVRWGLISFPCKNKIK